RWLAYVVDPESYGGGSLATGRVTHAGQVGGETQDQEEHPGPPGWRGKPTYDVRTELRPLYNLSLIDHVLNPSVKALKRGTKVA
ncbi:hypothetical protein JTE90_023484, partial [Oedothorax gibbosus]